MSIQPLAHLTFKGNCREAFKFYADTFGGNIDFSMTYAEAPGAEQAPAEVRNQIIHTRLKLGSQYLLGCDAPADRYQTPQGFSVMAAVDTPADADRVFGALARGGTVTMPIGETFWALRFGMVTDRFGTPWMVNCAKPMDGGAAAAPKSA